MKKIIRINGWASFIGQLVGLGLFYFSTDLKTSLALFIYIFFNNTGMIEDIKCALKSNP